jgi:hypothetical protein
MAFVMLHFALRNGLLSFKEERLRMMRHINRWRFLGMSAGAANTSGHFPHVAEAATSISINGENSGCTFDGIGGLRSDSGTSHLLPDSPAQQQSEILDDLFKPNHEQSGKRRRYQLDQRIRDWTSAQSYRSELSSWQRMMVHGHAKVRTSTSKFYDEMGRTGLVPGQFQQRCNTSFLPDGWENNQGQHALDCSGRDRSDEYGAAQFAQRLLA